MIKVENCQACELRDNCVPLGGVSYGQGGIMFVLTSPNSDEELLRKPLECREGEFLKKLLIKKGITNYTVVYLIKCLAAANKIKRKHIDKCKGWLWQEIKYAKPIHIVAFGPLPCNTLLRRGLNKSINDFVSKPTQLNYIDAQLYPWPTLTKIISNKKIAGQFEEWLTSLSMTLKQ